MYELNLVYDLLVNINNPKLFSGILSFIKKMDYSHTKFIITINYFEIISLSNNIPHKLVAWPFDSINKLTTNLPFKKTKTISDDYIYIYDISQSMINELIYISSKSNMILLRTNSAVFNKNILTVSHTLYSTKSHNNSTYRQNSIDFDCINIRYSISLMDPLNYIFPFYKGKNDIKTVGFGNEIFLENQDNQENIYVNKLKEFNGIMSLFNIYKSLNKNTKVFLDKHQKFDQIQYTSGNYSTFLYIFSQNTIPIDFDTNEVNNEVNNYSGTVSI